MSTNPSAVVSSKSMPVSSSVPVRNVGGGGGPKKTSNIYLTRAARRQVPKGSGPLREFTHHSSDYNIWYHKKLGDRFDKEERVKSASRCCASLDSGWTRADKNSKGTYICIFFARGSCVNGAECSYYHRIPTKEDEARIDLTHDIFGRERHRTYRDDMGGVGSFTRNNRTLFISGLKRTANMEDSLTAHFVEWGELDTIRVQRDKAVAYVKYNLRVAAEFAKEAMTDQSLDNDETLTIRWATEDPNPESAAEEENEQLLEIAKAVATKEAEQNELYTYGEEGEPTTVGQFPSEQNPTEYPNTNAQYAYEQEQYYQQHYTTHGEGMEAVKQWMTSLGYASHSNDLISAGFMDLQSLTQLDEYGLDAAGITDEGQRTDILAKAAVLAQHLVAQSQWSEYGQYEQDETGQFMFTNAEYTGTDVLQYAYQPLHTVPATSQKPAQEEAEKLVAYGSDED